MLRKSVFFLFVLLVLIFITLYFFENNNEANVNDISFMKDSHIVLVDDSNSANVNFDVLTNIKEPRASDSSLHSLTEHKMELNGGYDAGIVSDDNVVDSTKLNSILASANFYEIIDVFSTMPDKSFEIIVFENSITDFPHLI